MNDTPHTPRPRLTTATEAGPRAGATDADFWALVDGIGRIETVESVETGAAEIAALEALMAAPAVAQDTRVLDSMDDASRWQASASTESRQASRTPSRFDQWFTGAISLREAVRGSPRERE